jgi:hypothetical protein
MAERNRAAMSQTYLLQANHKMPPGRSTSLATDGFNKASNPTVWVEAGQPQILIVRAGYSGI